MVKIREEDEERCEEGTRKARRQKRGKIRKDTKRVTSIIFFLFVFFLMLEKEQLIGVEEHE